MRTVDEFRSAITNRNLNALASLFTDDVRFYSPVKFSPFVGRPLVLGVFAVLMRKFEDFRYIGQFEGVAETASDGEEVPSVALLFQGMMSGKLIHGIDVLHFDGDGAIKEFTVMVRPQSALDAVSDAVLAGLVEYGLAPEPTGQ